MESYSKLRPWTAIESCSCGKIEKLLLVDLYTDNPIHCGDCRQEVDPERLNLDDQAVDQIAAAMTVQAALYNLWMDSGEYEAWAKARLTDPKSQVNVKGLAAARRLSQILPTYYWWFHDADDGDPVHCPNCQRPLDPDVRFGAGKCDACQLMI